jgi:hypothetical protein
MQDGRQDAYRFRACIEQIGAGPVLIGFLNDVSACRPILKAESGDKHGLSMEAPGFLEPVRFIDYQYHLKSGLVVSVDLPKDCSARTEDCS